MPIGGRDRPGTLQLKHWTTLVLDTKAAPRIHGRDITGMAKGIGSAADTLIAELANDGIKQPALGAIRQVSSTRAGLLRPVTEQEL